jgi:hypothetical protein
MRVLDILSLLKLLSLSLLNNYVILIFYLFEGSKTFSLKSLNLSATAKWYEGEK